VPPDALNHVVPVGWILAGAFAGFVSLVGLVVGAISWLDKRLDAKLKDSILVAFGSDTFETKVTKIVTAAINVQVEKDLTKVQERQAFQATSIQRAHERIDDLMKERSGLLTPPPRTAG
jgi:hypothetical protein